MFEFCYTTYQQPKKAFEDLKDKISKLELEPSTAIFFLSGRLSEASEIFKVECSSVSVPVEGIITPEGVWSRGALAFLTDSEVKIRIFDGTLSEICEKIKRMKKERFNLLIYPLIFLKSRLSMLKILLKLQRANIEKASKIFEEMIYPMNSLLRPFRDSGVTALSMNLFPLEIGVGIPKIAFNGKRIGRSVVCLSFKEKIGCEFTDTFPERGKSAEETVEILLQEVSTPRRVQIAKKGLVIEEIDGMSVRDFVRNSGIVMRENLQRDISSGKFFGATPYGLFLISKETFGSPFLGLMDYDLKYYPALFDLDVFFDEAVFGGEFVKGGMKKVLENISQCDFAFIDQNFMLMFEERVVEIAKVLKGYGVLTISSLAGEFERKKLMSEIEKGICVNATETMSFLKFK